TLLSAPSRVFRLPVEKAVAVVCFTLIRRRRNPAALAPAAIVNDHCYEPARGKIRGEFLNRSRRLAPAGGEHDRWCFAFSREFLRRENLSIALNAFAVEADVFRGDAVRE